MNIIHISRYSSIGLAVSDFVQEPVPSGTRLEDWVRLHEAVLSDAGVIVVDAFFSLYGGIPAEPEGIRLLKILRLMGYRQHVIFYSIYPIEDILLEYRHCRIMKSRGTSYFQLPCVIDDAVCAGKAGLECEEDLLPFFRDEAMEWMGTSRHSLANWWGVLRLYELLQCCGLADGDVSAGIRDALRRDSSYEGLLMNFVRFHGPKPGFSVRDGVAESLISCVKALWWKEPKVIYIDDHADDGWSYLLQMILYGRERPELFIVPDLPDEGIDIRGLASEITSYDPDLVISDIRLEPKDESSRLSELSGVQLIRSLSTEYRCPCPVLAFTASDKRRVSEAAMNAGADAVWTKEGVDEGKTVPADSYISFSISRLIDLVIRLNRLAGTEYRILYDFRRKIEDIKSFAGQYWWQNTKWFEEDPKGRTPISKDRLVGELESLFMTHKQFLTASQPEIVRCVYDMLTFKLCRMMETFHPTRYESDTFISLKKALDEDWPASSIAAAYASFIVRERNCIFHFRPSEYDAESGAIRYEKILSAFITYITLRNPSAALGRETGSLVCFMADDGRMSYRFHSASITGIFKNEEDVEKCKAILGSESSVEGVSVLPVQQPAISYRLGDVTLSESYKADIENYWLAHYSILSVESWGGLVSLHNISPRKNTSFLIIAPEESFYVGDRIYFYIKWDYESRAGLSLMNVTLNPPEPIKHTYWSAVVAGTRVSENWVRVRLRGIEAPFNLTFKVDPNAMQVIKSGTKASRICFSPRWAQFWTLTDPEKI